VPNEFQPKVKGRLLDDGVSMFLEGGRVFEGWQDLSITKNIESIAHGFTFSYDNKFDDLKTQWPIKPGEKVSINIGTERVITGRIDRLDVDFSADSRSISVSGRSLAGDLVDCSVSGAKEFENITIVNLARELVAPYKLQVFTSVESKTLDKFALKPGETVFQALDRAARVAGFFWISTREGNIRLTRAARARATSQIHQDVNMLSGSIGFDESERFSQVTVIGQRSGLDNFPGTDATQATGTSFDRGVTRFRPFVKIAESSVDSAQAKESAGWETSNRIARGMTVKIETQGWRQADGSLWGINQLIRIKSNILGIDTELLSSAVEQTKSSTGGTITNLTLVRKDSFKSEPEFAKDDDLLSLLGGG